ncbi:YdaU family protein [Bradyrhizobium sp.]|uniref:YdaU family protein n=1 Tax=Bradyrhizobium sp. TaxID=376 RepID=UPI003C43423F
MSKRAYFPLYVGDYLGDTGHLSTAQHGAYLLLMMHYWRMGELPTDDKQLAAITKLPLRLWLDCKDVIQSFFFDGWRHKRIDEELSKMAAAANRRAAAGQKGGLRAAMNRMLLEDAAGHSNATAMLEQSRRVGRSNAAAEEIAMLQPGSSTKTKNRNITSTDRVERAKGQPMEPLRASPELEAILARKS